MKYLILGQGGWLAQKFNRYLEDSYNSEVDILDLPALRKELDDKKPKVVLNCAGITGRPNIDWCEDHKAETVAGNVAVPLNILQACSEKNIYWVHLSSGCVFQGEGKDGKGFCEDDPATPPSFYSFTKYWADQILKNFPVLIARLRLPIDVEPNPRNLIDKLAKYPQIIDVENSVTIIPDLLEVVKKLIEKRCIGIYHVTNPGTIKHSEFMELYKKHINPEHKYELISVEDLYKKGLAKARRSNCILNTDKLQGEGIALKPIKERIIEVMEEYSRKFQPEADSPLAKKV
ncbi:MAG: sugar nucleotide-binding protein [Candidatus Portnoybacteria bacterium]|nr:sugar nucleotide-binding protein [Candidatus Portnoybacteria bacterium]